MLLGYRVDRASGRMGVDTEPIPTTTTTTTISAPQGAVCPCPPQGVRQIVDQCGGRVGVREQLLNESQLTHSRAEPRRTAAALTGTPHSYTENNIPTPPSRRAREQRHSDWEGRQLKYIRGDRTFLNGRGSKIHRASIGFGFP